MADGVLAAARSRHPDFRVAAADVRRLPYASASFDVVISNSTTAAIEGYGRVGSALAPLLAQAGARVVAVSSLHGARYHPDGLPVERQDPFRAQAKDPPTIRSFRPSGRPALPLRPPPFDRCGSGVAPAGASGGPWRQQSPHARGRSEPSRARRGGGPGFRRQLRRVLGGTMEFASLLAVRIRDLIETRFRGRRGTFAARSRLAPGQRAGKRSPALNKPPARPESLSARTRL